LPFTNAASKYVDAPFFECPSSGCLSKSKRYRYHAGSFALKVGTLDKTWVYEVHYYIVCGYVVDQFPQEHVGE
jgi:hypothetical protein